MLFVDISCSVLIDMLVRLVSVKVYRPSKHEAKELILHDYIPYVSSCLCLLIKFPNVHGVVRLHNLFNQSQLRHQVE